MHKGEGVRPAPSVACVCVCVCVCAVGAAPCVVCGIEEPVHLSNFLTLPLQLCMEILVLLPCITIKAHVHGKHDADVRV